MRHIGSLAVGMDEEVTPATIHGRNRTLRRIRESFAEFLKGRETRRRLAERDMALIRETDARIAKWTAVLDRNQDIVDDFQRPGFVQWRQELEREALVDLQKMPDQELDRWRAGNPTALVNAIHYKLVMGLFKSIDDAIAESQKAERFREAALTKLHDQSETMKE